MASKVLSLSYRLERSCSLSNLPIKVNVTTNLDIHYVEHHVLNNALIILTIIIFSVSLHNQNLSAFEYTFLVLPAIRGELKFYIM